VLPQASYPFWLVACCRAGANGSRLRDRLFGFSACATLFCFAAIVMYGSLLPTQQGMDKEEFFFERCDPYVPDTNCMNFTQCQIVDRNGTLQDLGLRALEPNSGLLTPLTAATVTAALLSFTLLGQTIMLSRSANGDGEYEKLPGTSGT